MRKRADVALVELRHFPSRARARDAIEEGMVLVDGAPVRKASELIELSSSIEARAPHPWASRGGVKLAHALDVFGFDPSGRAALDVGASTGGFTDVLLARGARSVDAVDVGAGQLDARLRGDPRVHSLEGLDARRIDASMLIATPQAIVCDVSFISLRLVLPHVLPLAAPGAWLAALIKPQFEAGREHVRKGFVVDPRAIDAACEAVAALLRDAGWSIVGFIPSPIRGGDGQQEFLIGARQASRND
jgi:23S rRNA (cytidine1920-2'-O)/16S rRNA (cytidine1409-2'-O)-methyltransferase